MTKKIKITLFVAGLAPFLGLLVYAHFQPLGIFGSAEELRVYVLGFGVWAWLVFLALQILQVIVTPINHMVVGIAGGFIFGFWWGFLLNWVGRVIGHAIAFAVARNFGRPLVKKMIGEDTLSKYDNFCRKGGPVSLALMYFMPLFPDDELSYIAGISDMNYKVFLLAAFFGHIGGSTGNALLGAGIAGKDKWLLVIYISAFIAVFGLWFVRKPIERFVAKFDKKVNN